jgi:hypothetical protein
MNSTQPEKTEASCFLGRTGFRIEMLLTIGLRFTLLDPIVKEIANNATPAKVLKSGKGISKETIPR